MKSKFLKVNLVLFFLAAAIAGYLVYNHYALINGDAGFKSFCSINKTVDCDAVNSSEYSEIAGIPLSSVALGYYFFALVLTICALLNVYLRREATLLLLPISFLSALASLTTFSLSLFVLHTFCLMCSGLQILNIATFICTLVALRDLTATSSITKQWRETRRNTMITFVITGVGLMLATIAISAQLKKEIPFDEEAFINDFRAQPVQNIDPGDSARQGFQGDNPPVRIIEFADFQCPGCGIAARYMHRLTRTYANKIQLIFKSFPLDQSCNPHITRPMHEFACAAAKAAQCAHKQGKFVDMYEKLYGNQHEINRDSIAAWAKEIGLDMAQFDACTASPETTNAILHDIDLASSLGVGSTPTFFVNGRKVEGAINDDRLKSLLRDLGK